MAGAVGARLWFLQVSGYDSFADRASRQQVKRIVIQPERGEILDRGGRPLATSTGTLSVYADTKYFNPPEADVDLDALANQIAYYTNQTPQTVRQRLENGKGVVTLGRQLEVAAARRVGDLIEDSGVTRRGYWYHRESKRLYPRHLAAHAIGFCGTDGDGDNRGMAGLEFLLNKELQGTRIEGTAFRTAISQVMQPVEQEELLDARGNTLVLTIDAAVQEAAEGSLAKAAEEYEAAAAGAVVQDVLTGDIIAIASWPGFDNSRQSDFPPSVQRNRVLTDPLETGSVAKLFTAAILLDAGLVSLDTMIDCEGGRAIVAGRRVTDAPGHYLHVAPFYEVIRYSSNVGTIKAAQALENEQWYNYLRAFGLGQASGIDLPGEGTGILYPTSKWTRLSRTSLPMGYEMSLTSIQIVNGITGLVNGGELLVPHIVKEVRDPRGAVIRQTGRTVHNRMIRPSTSLLMREIMEDVVAHGTGTKAQVPGFRVGGKTGTTVKSHVLTHKEYIASFVGVIPINDPKYSIYCYIDDPKGKHYASEVAAPVFQEIAKAVVIHMGLIPSEPAAGEAEPLLAEAGGSDAPLPLWLEAPPAVQGTMPELRGRSMAEVRRLLPRAMENVRFVGTGRVSDQAPVAGEALVSTSEVILFFDPEVSRGGDSTEAQVAENVRREP
ncbi:hypothetical protein HZA57_07910 [Candidatus Poribacteria bacterium]|nr:hypothetical protein [Candidatus Poribacteria bacterium]